MKSFVSIGIYLFIVNICFGQNKSYVDIAPYSSNCGDDLEKVFECTDDVIYKFMVQDIDLDACPETDTVAHYNLNFIVDAQGNIIKPNVTSWSDSESCLSYMNDRAKLLGDHLQMKAAQLNNQSVEFSKKLTITHPLDSAQAVQLNSTKQFVVVEEMPRFTGCEDMRGTAKDKEMCAQHDMLMFLYKNLKYPREARENGVEGMVVAQFVVDTTGQLLDMNIVREIGGDCGTAVLEVLEAMNTTFNNKPFTPGRQSGKKVKVLYTLPVKFKLESNTLFKKKKKKKKRKG